MVSNQSKLNFRQIRDEQQGLAITRLLWREEPSGRSNEDVLALYLDSIALGGTRDQIRNALLRLERLGVLETEMVNDALMVVRLTANGHAAAKGEIALEGIPRVLPDCPY